MGRRRRIASFGIYRLNLNLHHQETPVWNIHLYQSPRFLDTKPIELANAIGEYWEKALEWNGYVEQGLPTRHHTKYAPELHCCSILRATIVTLLLFSSIFTHPNATGY